MRKIGGKVMITRIGRRTLGLCIVLFGILLLTERWIGLSFSHVFDYIWPLLIISFLLEIIFFYKKREEEDRLTFDKGSMTLLIIVIIIGNFYQSYAENENGWSALFQLLERGESITIQENYPLSDTIKEIYVELPAGKVHIEGTDNDDIVIEGTVTGKSFTESELERHFNSERIAEEDGDIFSYKIETENSWFPTDENLKADIVINVPDHVIVRTELMSGAVQVDNVANDVVIETRNGHVKVANITGDLYVRNTNGHIELTTIDGSVDVSTSNGKITGEDMMKDASLKTTNGAITAESTVIGGEWDLSTSNGKVTLSLPEDSHVTFRGSTSNGRVHGNLAWEGQEKGTRGEAVIGNGTHMIESRTSNGSIEVNQ